ncbi:MAG: adenylate kinase family protein [Candidatus Methanospirareceae archaeon]
MIIGVTGTPGTGKTSVCKASGLEFIEINKIVREKRFYTGVDRERNSLIVDVERLREYVRAYYREWKRGRKGGGEDLLVDGHLAHYLELDIVIVLRANPLLLRERLRRKGFGEKKVKENIQAEALDVILVEAVEMCDEVYEIDTSERSIEEVVNCMKEIINWCKGGRIEGKGEIEKYKPGSVDWSNLIEEVFNDP